MAKNVDTHQDSHLVQLWVKKHLLTKWDKFAEQFSLNRTAFIIQACNDYMLTHTSMGKTELEESNLKTVTGTQAKFYRERNFSLQERRELYDKWNPFKGSR